MYLPGPAGPLRPVPRSATSFQFSPDRPWPGAHVIEMPAGLFYGDPLHLPAMLPEPLGNDMRDEVQRDIRLVFGRPAGHHAPPRDPLRASSPHRVCRHNRPNSRVIPPTLPARPVRLAPAGTPSRPVALPLLSSPFVMIIPSGSFPCTAGLLPCDTPQSVCSPSPFRAGPGPGAPYRFSRRAHPAWRIGMPPLRTTITREG